MIVESQALLMETTESQYLECQKSSPVWTISKIHKEGGKKKNQLDAVRLDSQDVNISNNLGQRVIL